MKSIGEVVESHRVVICAGSGGVGKTTAAAALAVYGAERGRRTVVLTIDPARRLADALGLKQLGNEARAVDLDGRGELSAMMLDQKGAWDRLVERYAPSEEARERILANRFYQHLSQSFAGSQEYMAVEQLSELHESGRFDLIVVDTPPTRHALDFLEAPKRLADFLDRDVVRWFVKPYFSASWSAVRLMNRTAGSVFRRLEEATGVATLVEISEFFTSMSGLFEGFEQRVQRVDELLRSPRTGFVLVTSGEQEVLDEARFFAQHVKELSIPLRGVVFNRVHEPWETDAERHEEAWLSKSVERIVGDRECGRALTENFWAYEVQARGDRRRVEAFRKRVSKRAAVAVVPNFDEDLHDIEGLRRMIPYLTAE